jgi:hypothetical protein
LVRECDEVTSRFFRDSAWYDLDVPAWLLVVLIVLTVYRVTRLIIADTFPPIGVPRTHLLNWWVPDDDWIATHKDARPHWGALGRSLKYLFTCPWCMSVWAGGILIWAVDAWWVAVPVPFFVWAAASAVTGLLSNLEDKLS